MSLWILTIFYLFDSVVEEGVVLQNFVLSAHWNLMLSKLAAPSVSRIAAIGVRGSAVPILRLSRGSIEQQLTTQVKVGRCG